MKKLMLSVGLVTVLASTAFAQGGVTQSFRECRSSDDGQFFWNTVTYNIYPNPAPTGSREVMEMENTGDACMAHDYEQARRFAALYGEEWTPSEELDEPAPVVEAQPEPMVNYSNVQNQPMVDEPPPASVQNEPMVDEPPPANSYASYQRQGNQYQYQNQGNQYQNQGNQYQGNQYQSGPNFQYQRPMMQTPVTTNHPAPGARFIPPTSYKGQYFGSAAPRKVVVTRTATRGRVRTY